MLSDCSRSVLQGEYHTRICRYRASCGVAATAPVAAVATAPAATKSVPAAPLAGLVETKRLQESPQPESHSAPPAMLPAESAAARAGGGADGAAAAQESVPVTSDERKASSQQPLAGVVSNPQ